MASKKKSAKIAAGVVGLTDPDSILTHHLEMAESHLIEAVRLFEKSVKPERRPDYVARLTRAQELVTWLFREELIRIRGPIKVTAGIGKRKK